MNQHSKKMLAAQAAVDFVQPDSVLGVGTGSTVNCFIECLEGIKSKITGAISSSNTSSDLLRKIGIPIVDLNSIDAFDIYVDGADESDSDLHLIKGGGGALTREKIVAQAATQFVCIIDDSKWVQHLGKFPLPIEVIPMARNQITKTVASQFGGVAKLRDGFVTDNGHEILDVYDLDIDDPKTMETQMNQIPGVVTVGLFALRGADILIMGTDKGVQIRGNTTH